MLRIEEQDGLQLQSAHAGPNKDTLDHVDLDLCVQAVVASFGPFVKYRTSLLSESHLSLLAIPTACKEYKLNSSVRRM